MIIVFFTKKSFPKVEQNPTLELLHQLHGIFPSDSFGTAGGGRVPSDLSRCHCIERYSIEE